MMELSIEQAQLIINQKQEYDTLLTFNGVSKAQLKQDIFVLSELKFKRNGYFVEFGATNGVHFSNTHLLEKEFGWTGILCEPIASHYSDLIKTRSCHIEDKCVWSVSNQFVDFLQTPILDLSTIQQFHDHDGHSNYRCDGVVSRVQTITLNDLLDKYHAPRNIDYLSVDTEGSELDILSAVDFKRWVFNVITVEHNYTSQRAKINHLLTSHGYVQKYPFVSQFDDWYVFQG